MFRFLQPGRPIEQSDQEWLIRRLNWLLGRYGSEYLVRTPPILPTVDALGVPFDRSPKAARSLFSWVCRHMKLNEAHIHFKLFEAQRKQAAEFDLFTGSIGFASSHSAGLYEDSYDQAVLVDKELLRSFVPLIATIAHELSHVKLHRETDIDRSWPDYEKLTDLASVFFGFGLFLMQTAEQDINVEGEPNRRMGYLPTALVCHTLAIGAFIQGDTRVRWMRHMDCRTRRFFKDSHRYLRWTNPPAVSLGPDGLLALGSSVHPPLDLNAQLQRAIAREDYGEAARLKKLIDGKK
ncbi:MAG: hypothetical protein AMXMBFR7_31550 [Planctomycetota bacterium]